MYNNNSDSLGTYNNNSLYFNRIVPTSVVVRDTI